VAVVDGVNQGQVVRDQVAVALGEGGGSVSVVAPWWSVAPASCPRRSGGWLATQGGLARIAPGAQASAFVPQTTRPGRYAVARRQSLRGISILALGSHRSWLPRVPAPPKVQSWRDCLQRPQENRRRRTPFGWRCISIPGRPLVEFQIVLPEDPSKRTGRSRRERLVPLD